MEVRSQGELILLTVFILGIVVELFYVVPVITTENRIEVVLERIFIAGIIISILIILVIVLLRQRNLIDKLRYLDLRRPMRTHADVRKELSGLYRDLGALKIVYKDGLIKGSDYAKKKKLVDELIKKKQAELQGILKSEKKAKEKSEKNAEEPGKKEKK